MYTLRKITNENVEMNIGLGSEYTLIRKETCEKEFNFFCQRFDYTDEDVERDGIYAIISSYDGSKLIPLYKCQLNFIMTENGKTFSNVTFK